MSVITHVNECVYDNRRISHDLVILFISMLLPFPCVRFQFLSFLLACLLFPILKSVGVKYVTVGRKNKAKKKQTNKRERTTSHTRGERDEELCTYRTLNKQNV